MQIQNNKYRQNGLIFYGLENFCKPENKPSIDDSTNIWLRNGSGFLILWNYQMSADNNNQRPYIFKNCMSYHINAR